MQRGGGGFAFGPRLYVDLADLRGLGLLGFGSSATYQTYLRTEEAGIVALTTRLRDAFAQQTVSIRSWRAFEDRLGRNLTTAENYLSLVGFAMVVLGGIGVWSVTRVIVQQKVRSVAILKCLGASSRAVLGTYVTVVLWLATAGCALGLAIAAAVVTSVPAAVLQPLGISSITITASGAIQGVLVGLLVSLLFALVPLLEMRRVKPLLLLRADTATSARKPDRASRLASVTMGAALILVAVWQAGSAARGPVRVPWSRRVCASADTGRAHPDPGDVETRACAVVRTAPRHHQSGKAGEPDTGDPDRRRSRCVLRALHPRDSVESAGRVLRADRPDISGSGADRRPARPGRRRR